MKNNRINHLVLRFFFFFICFFVFLSSISNRTIVTSTIYEPTKLYSHRNTLNKENLLEELKIQQIKYPEIVLAQALLETGHFKSKVCREKNNLFGLYNSKTKSYYSFNHWWESVVAYKKLIEYKHKPKENYFSFLERIGYAEDPNYINKIKSIVSLNTKSN